MERVGLAGHLDSAERHLSSKRSRSWEVDVSLDELVEWEALEQFMQDIPSTDQTTSSDRSCSAPHTDVGVAPPVPVRPPMPSSCAMGRNSADARAGGLIPGPWPYMGTGLDGAGPSGFLGGHGQLGGLGANAASLAQSLYAGWQQNAAASLPLQALPMERGVSWGAELLPYMMEDGEAALMDAAILDGPQAADNGRPRPSFDTLGSNNVVDDAPNTVTRPMHKQRFVWTGELHRRFEAAVNTLGIDQAKPQAISQLMNCEGEGAPTRQNIKSHLQKYRLLMQKRARQGGGNGDAARTAGTSADGISSSGAGASASDQPADVQSELEQHLEKQEMNLKMQMDLQTKLHRQLLVQRQLQHQLEHCFPSQGEGGSDDRQRYQATLSLKNSLRERLTKHVMLQQEMLQHLDALVSSEAGKSKDADSTDTGTTATSSVAEKATSVVKPEEPQPQAAANVD